MPLQTFATLVPTPAQLKVKLRVHNPSNRYEIFSQMTCSREENWRCDHSSIFLAVHACTRNFLQTIILPPGHSYEGEVWPLVTGKISPGKVKLRFGLIRQRSNFTSQEIERVYRAQEQIDFSSLILRAQYKAKNDVFWTKPQTIVLRKEWIEPYRGG